MPLAAMSLGHQDDMIRRNDGLAFDPSRNLHACPERAIARLAELNNLIFPPGMRQAESASLIRPKRLASTIAIERESCLHKSRTQTTLHPFSFHSIIAGSLSQICIQKVCPCSR